ncbi:DUF4115 domain-containing protein [Litorivita pollutaquae]|uniref:DUF4115 domain-containing protein n=1 Tax=Litorivita pollutaquae TaxID=2200892 RepID=A0A2V4NF03_9RHOB|nr:helix-turn-helix domain-containing protein [Litorivita pollutaquae]PYC48470.1 DUF4115 domain-containing protein [Litorivita pollutaquae]
MIRRKLSRDKVEVSVDQPRGFDAFELRLGDTMRGERATMGKSLLDVQRELRIKASYIAAIENTDPSAFDTPGFIAGYVRSYARYLNMDPDAAFAQFCTESGFSIAHGMSSEASSPRREAAPAQRAEKDPFGGVAAPFTPIGDSFLSRIEPGAIGSVLVLALLIGGIGYGGYSVLNEVQRVQFAPVENTPTVLSDLDPLEGAMIASSGTDEMRAADTGESPTGIFAPPANAMDRLYRPQALDVPVMVARDAPISMLDPSMVGTFSGQSPNFGQSPNSTPMMADAHMADHTPQNVQVVEGPAPEVVVVAARPAWVRVRAADGTVIFEGIMNAGDRYAVPATEEPATLRVGESGAIYFAVNGQHVGPAGPSGSVTSKLPLSVAHLTQTYQVASLEKDGDLARVVAELVAPRN